MKGTTAISAGGQGTPPLPPGAAVAPLPGLLRLLEEVIGQVV